MQSSQNSMQAENFRKLLLAMSEDVRVLLVKLADRTHNMRTISFIAKDEKRQRIARETLEIYAPLAERIGVTYLQHDLENDAFAVLHSEMNQTISNRLEFFGAGIRNCDPDDQRRIAGCCRAGGYRMQCQWPAENRLFHLAQDAA